MPSLLDLPIELRHAVVEACAPGFDELELNYTSDKPRRDHVLLLVNQQIHDKFEPWAQKRCRTLRLCPQFLVDDRVLGLSRALLASVRILEIVRLDEVSSYSGVAARGGRSASAPGPKTLCVLRRELFARLPRLREVHLFDRDGEDCGKDLAELGLMPERSPDWFWHGPVPLVQLLLEHGETVGAPQRAVASLQELWRKTSSERSFDVVLHQPMMSSATYVHGTKFHWLPILVSFVRE
jgi:hypothetical protein